MPVLSHPRTRDDGTLRFEPYHVGTSSDELSREAHHASGPIHAR